MKVINCFVSLDLCPFDPTLYADLEETDFEDFLKPFQHV